MSETDEIREIVGKLKMAEEVSDRLTSLLDALDERYPVAFHPSTSRHVPVETVDAYGLRIEVDAHGRASRVSLPGLGVLGEPHSDYFDVEWSW